MSDRGGNGTANQLEALDQSDSDISGSVMTFYYGNFDDMDRIKAKRSDMVLCVVRYIGNIKDDFIRA